MKKNMMITLVLLAFNITLFKPAYLLSQSAKESLSDTSTQKIDYYTCAMHRQIHENHPGSCPICGMTLIPIYQEQQKTSPKESEKKVLQEFNNDEKMVQISSERQQVIGVKKSVVEKKDVSYILSLNGKVAYDPELYIAQQEYVDIIKNVPNLKASARQRLILLGMSPDEIRDLEKNKSNKNSESLMMPGKGYWVYATVYPQDIKIIKTGMKALVQNDEGVVMGIAPILDSESQSARVRILIKSDVPPTPNSFVTAQIKVPFHESLIIPTTAVIDTGKRKIVYGVTHETEFHLKEIKTSYSNSEFSIVTEGLKEGDVIATSAAFLIDSESQLSGGL